MAFEIEYDKQPKKFLKHLDKHLVKRLMDKIDETLMANPVPHDAKSIVGQHGQFHIRIGDYRVLYQINYPDKKVVIVMLDKRPRAYD